MIAFFNSLPILFFLSPLAEGEKETRKGSNVYPAVP
jgi:hypothetical protein